MILEVIGYIITVSLATIIPPFTVVPLELVAPSRYGLFLAFVYTLLGNILGASVPFLLARRYGWGLMEKLFKEKEVEKEIEENAEELGFAPDDEGPAVEESSEED